MFMFCSIFEMFWPSHKNGVIHPMTHLSKKYYAKAVQAAQYLRHAEKPMRILRSISWEPHIREAFFAAKEQKLPQVDYPKFDGARSREGIENAKALLIGDHPVFAWLRRVGGTLETTSEMLENLGTPKFFKYSSQLYRPPNHTLIDGKTRTIDLARHMDASLDGLGNEKLILGREDKSLNATLFASRLREKLGKYFDANMPEIRLEKNLSAKVLAGAKRIRIHKDAKFTSIDIRQLLHHEALVHVGTALNGRSQKDFPILGSAHAGTTEIQEGLAVFAEIITGAMDPVRFRRLVDRVIAIHMSVQGADFIEVYRYFLTRTTDKTQAFEDTRRVFRGGIITGGAPFTKDGVYLNGLLRVHNFLRTVTKLGRADLIRLLFVGKMDLEDIPALASLAASEKLVAPQVLPPWIKDMRFLVSYLAYSSFLNQVKLPGFQTYYANLLEEVPDVWGLAISP